MVAPRSSAGLASLPRRITLALRQARSEVAGTGARLDPDRLPGGWIRMDGEGRICEANRTMARILVGGEGGPASVPDPRTLIGRPFTDLLLRSEGRHLIQGALQGGEAVALTAELRQSDGAVALVAIALWPPEPDERAGGELQPPRLEGVVLPVDRPAGAQALPPTGQSFDELSAALVQDLEEPLQLIAQYAHLLSERYAGKLDDNARRLIGRLEESSDRMRRMVEGILRYVSPQRPTRPFTTVDVRRVLDTVRERLRGPLAESGAELTHGELPAVVADERDLITLFEQLVRNAIQYRGDAPLRIHIEGEERGSDWLISVTDNGIGVDPRFADRIFDLFQRIPPPEGGGGSPGAGIGLALCRQIAARHGGDIWVRSEPGKGATFLVTLAKRQGASGTPGGGRASPAEKSGGAQGRGDETGSSGEQPPAEGGHETPDSDPGPTRAGATALHGRPRL